MTASTNDHDKFLMAVEALRDSNAGVRTTAHTSSVSADDWAPAITDSQTQDPEADLPALQ
ncbi:MAG: hypothetical protein ACRCYX_11995 [Dermatophilaceae bacterium]